MKKKIAVLRANALGDFIFALPALQAIKEANPEAEIVYLGKAWHKNFLEDRPVPVDRVEVIPPYPGVGEPTDLKPNAEFINSFFRRMQDESFDIAFQMHGGGLYSNPFVNRLKAKLTVGLKTPDAEPLHVNVPYITAYSEILRYLEVVSQVGVPIKNIEPQFIATDNDILEAELLLKPDNLKPVAVIHPGASDLRRRWPPEYFAEIASFLAAKNFRVYVSGVPEEQEIITKIFDYIPDDSAVYNLCGHLPLSTLTGLLSRAQILISNDTGPLHLARALGTPTIGLFWTINSLTAIPMTTAKHRSLISWDPRCPICGVDCLMQNHFNPDCDHQTSFISTIKTKEVQQALLELL